MPELDVRRRQVCRRRQARPISPGRLCPAAQRADGAWPAPLEILQEVRDPLRLDAVACWAGGNHDHRGSGDYTLITNAGQGNWRSCKKCHGLWFGGGGAAAGPLGGVVVVLTPTTAYARPAASTTGAATSTSCRNRTISNPGIAVPCRERIGPCRSSGGTGRIFAMAPPPKVVALSSASDRSASRGREEAQPIAERHRMNQEPVLVDETESHQAPANPAPSVSHDLPCRAPASVGRSRWRDLPSDPFPNCHPRPPPLDQGSRQSPTPRSGRWERGVGGSLARDLASSARGGVARSCCTDQVLPSPKLISKLVSRVVRKLVHVLMTFLMRRRTTLLTSCGRLS